MANPIDTYECLVNHIFLPPELPQSGDDLPFDTLVRTTSQALLAFKQFRPDQHASLNAIAELIDNTRYAHSGGRVNEVRLVELLAALPRKGGSIVLHVGAQNAGIVISSISGLRIRFKIFELSPLNEAVYAQKGRLRRSFPGSAIDVDFKTFGETGFVPTTAQTLAKLSSQAAPGM